jgi:putative AlgH/UPF0301 family transcriptional regulator
MDLKVQKKNEPSNLTGQLLIAMPNMADARFGHAASACVALGLVRAD